MEKYFGFGALFNAAFWNVNKQTVRDPAMIEEIRTIRLTGTTENKNEQHIVQNAKTCRCIYRQQSSDAPKLTDGEQKITKILKTKFPKAEDVQVQDISGGCGSMYEVFISSVEFKGLRTVQQHRMVNEALKEEIKSMHGLRISTQSP